MCLFGRVLNSVMMVGLGVCDGLGIRGKELDCTEKYLALCINFVAFQLL